MVSKYQKKVLKEYVKDKLEELIQKKAEELKLEIMELSIRSGYVLFIEVNTDLSLKKII